MLKRDFNVKSVAEAGLCNGCGACQAICPHKAVVVQEKPNGLLQASVSDEHCSQCKKCLNVCGGWRLAQDAMPQKIDPFVGPTLKAYLTRASDEKLWKHGQSGGAVTALTTHLLTAHKVDGVLTTTMPKDGTLRPRASIVRDPRKLIQGQGSKYVPVSFAEPLEEMRQKESDRIAVVGLGCHFRSLANDESTPNPTWKDRVTFKIGLGCDRVLSSLVIEHLIKSVDFPVEEVASYEFRSKLRSGWPGEGRILTNDNQVCYVPNHNRLRCKEAFTPLACRLCFDKANILSDITAFDPWGLTKDSSGWTLLITRTLRGQQLLDSAEKSGYLIAKEVEMQSALQGQGLKDKQKAWAEHTKLHMKSGKVVPDFGVPPLNQPPLSSRETLNFKQKYLQSIKLAIKRKVSQ